MHGRPPQSRRAGRSDMYSESKFSHWARYDPYASSEDARLPRGLQPAAVVPTGSGASCPVYQRPLHPAFVWPVTPQDVAGVLSLLPPRYLKGLGGVVLLGGTAKQDKVCYSGLFRYGCYAGDTIYLHAFPRRCLSYHFGRLPKPSVVQEYRRAGAAFEPGPSGWACRFDRDSLRRFYLYDVLVHEVGHHVDRHNRHKSDRSAELFAEWFARTHGDRCRKARRPAAAVE